MGNQVITVYWGGRLFNQAERIWNANCAEKLRGKGRKVNLPQDDAEQFLLPDGTYDLDALARNCIKDSMNSDVGCYNLDGSDVDSGTALEAGAKIANKMATGQGLILGIRTDFRGSSEDKRTGVNAMFRLCDDIIVYKSDDNIDALIDSIDARIQVWVNETS